MDVLRKLREEGPERCRANLPLPFKVQAEPLILALAEIKERAIVEACTGFVAIMTDVIGMRSLEPSSELYEGMERAGAIRPHKLKRLVNRGQRLAILALRREEESGGRMPAKAEPTA